MGDYSNQASYLPNPYPDPQGQQQQGYTPSPTPPPSGGFDWGSLLALTPAHLIPSLLRMIVPGLGGVMDDVGAIQAGHAARTMGMVAHLYQDPSFNALQYGNWPNIPGMPPNPVTSVPAGGSAPGGVGGPFPGGPGGPPPGLRPEDVNRLSVQGPSSGLSGYQPTHYPVGMPPRVLTESDTKTQLNSAEAEAWRRFNQNAGTGMSDVPPAFEPVIGTPGHYLYYNGATRDGKGVWHPSYTGTPPLHPQTGQVARPPDPATLRDPNAVVPGQHTPPATQGEAAGRPDQGGGAQGPGYAGREIMWADSSGTVHRGIVKPDQTVTAPDGGTGIVGQNPDGSLSVIDTTPTQQAKGGPTPTSTTSTTTTTAPPRTLAPTTTTSQPRTIGTTTTTQPPAAGGAVAAPGAPGGASSSPDMQTLDAIPMPTSTTSSTSTTAPPTSTTVTPTTTTRPPTTAPPTSTTQTPTTTQPPTTAAPTTTAPPTTAPPPTSTTTTQPPPLDQHIVPVPGFMQGRTGSPSPAFRPPGEAAGLAIGQAVGTAPGVETPPEPSILSRAASALGPSEAQAGGPPGGLTGGNAGAEEPGPVPAEPPDVPTSEMLPSQQMRADIAQAIARNTNGIQYHLQKEYGSKYPNLNDIPSSILLNDGVAVDAGRAIEKMRTVDMARARAQATPEERAKIDAADTAYNRLYQLYLTEIGNSGRKGLDASIPTPTGPGLSRAWTETGPLMKEWTEGHGPASWIGTVGHSLTRSGAGIPNAPASLESVQQMANRGGIPGIAATQFLQGHLVAIPIARALGASGRVNQRELSLIQQYLIPSTDTTYEANYQKLQNTLNTLDAIRRGYKVDSSQTGMVLMTGPDGEPHLVELGGATGPNEGNPKVAIPGVIGGGQYATQPQGRFLGR